MRKFIGFPTDEGHTWLELRSHRSCMLSGGFLGCGNIDAVDLIVIPNNYGNLMNFMEYRQYFTVNIFLHAKIPIELAPCCLWHNKGQSIIIKWGLNAGTGEGGGRMEI